MLGFKAETFSLHLTNHFVLNGVAFLFVKNVLGLWYIGYFLFLGVERFWKRQEDEATSRRISKTTADRLFREQRYNWNRRTKWESG